MSTIELATLDKGVRGAGDPTPGPSIPPTPARSLNNSPDHSRRTSYDFPSRPPSAVTTTPKANYEYPSPAPSAGASRAPSLHSHSRRPSEEEVGIAELDDDTATTALPPVDGGKRAWIFLAAATFIETTVWGLPFTVGVFHQYWQTRMFPHDESTLTLAATLQTALMYMSTAALGP